MTTLTTLTCPICGELRFGRHTCPPAWRVYEPEIGETPADAVTVYATDARQAAEARAAATWSYHDYATELAFAVQPLADPAAPWERWDVEVAMEPVFVAQRAREGARA